MSQFDYGTIDPTTKSGSALAGDLNSFRDALHSTHKGPAAPSYAVAGLHWIDDTGDPIWLLKVFDGADWIVEAVIDTTNNVSYPVSVNPVLTYPTAGGSANALTLTPAVPMTAYANRAKVTFTAAFNNSGAATLNVSGVGAKAIRTIAGGTDIALVAGNLQAGRKYEVVYSSTANSGAGAWVLVNLPVTVGTTANTVAAGDDSRITGALQRSGGQMTGDLTLKGDPTTALMAATKQYADARGAPDAVMEDQKAAGTAGGSATTGAWIVRDLNTVVRNAGSVVSLSGNEFTPSVDGWVEWSSPTGSPVSNNSTRLYDVTDGVVAGFGTSNRKVDDASSSYSFGGAFVTAGKTYRIEHRFATAKSTDGLGMAGTFQTEVYTRVRFWRAA